MNKVAKITAVPDDARSVIRIGAGDIEHLVDRVEHALIQGERGLYQRHDKIVAVASTPVVAAHGCEVSSHRIFERGDHALLEDVSIVARFERHSGRRNAWEACAPPMMIVKTLRQRIGRLRFPVLNGVINAPTMRSDGSILERPGYDPETGLLFEPLGRSFPPIPDRPSRADAANALALLLDLLASFPFVSEPDRAVALSAILTAVIRRSLPSAPLHAFTAPVAGAGKSLLVDIAAIVAHGHEAAVIAQGASDEEFEKRLGSILVAGDAFASIDNCERPIGGDLLCQVLSQSTVRVRILGASETPAVATGIFIASTGNNLVVVGDLTRRAIICRLDPKVERPELRTFDRNPIVTAREQRGQLVAACLTVLRAFHIAKRPGRRDPLGSFEEWSALVRGALLWLDVADPVETMRSLRKADPKLESLRSVMSQWRIAFGDDCTTVANAVRHALDMTNGEFISPNLRGALLAVSGQGDVINAVRLGKWLAANAGRIVDGYAFEPAGTRQGVAIWTCRLMV